MADQRAQYNEEAVGANHPTKADVINRLALVEHGTDGVHGATARTSMNAMPAGAYELTDGATIAIDWDNGATQYVTLGATGRTITFANPVSGQVYRIIIIQDGDGARTITTWPTIKWAGGAAPTLSTGANDIDIVTLLYVGTTYYGDCSVDFAAHLQKVADTTLSGTPVVLSLVADGTTYYFKGYPTKA